LLITFKYIGNNILNAAKPAASLSSTSAPAVPEGVPVPADQILKAP
jgi:hypothetical protein